VTRTVVSVLITTLAAGIFTGVAGAHASLLRATPADGATAESSPPAVRLWFTEALAPRVLTARVYDGRGHVVPGTRVRFSGGSPHSFEVVLPHLRKGVYATVWTAMSKDDGHLTGGTLVFGVGVHAAAAGTPVPGAPPPGDALLRWLQFTFSAVLIGGLAFSILVLRPSSRAVGAAVGAPDRRVLALAAVSGVGGLLANGVLLARAVEALRDGRSLSVATRLVATSRWGELGLGSELALAALIGVTLVLRGPRRSALLPSAAAGAIVAAYAAAESLRSHAAATGGGLPRAALAVHLLAASVWLGGVLALALTLAMRRDLAPVLRGRFALLAGSGVVLVTVTGLYEVGREVVSVDALLLTFYGRALIVKVALVAVAVGLGAGHALALRRGAAVRRTLVLELGVGSAVLLAAGSLAAAAPARGPAWGPPRPVLALTLPAQSADLIAGVTVRPNRPGRNVFTVQVASSRRPAPAPVTAVSLRLPGAGVVDLRPFGPDRYLGVGYLPSPGAARGAIVFRRSGVDLRAPLGWSVEAPDPARPVAVSARRLDSLTGPLAGLVVLAAAAVAAFAAVRRLPSPRLSEVHL
jgi:copper transport protein